MAGLFVINIWIQASFFNINTHGMMHFDRFALLFNSIVFFPLVYFVRKGIWKSRYSLWRMYISFLLFVALSW
jgi:hypothetical protein